MVQLSVVYGSETWSVKNGYEKTEYMGEENICVECFVRISEQTATFALYSIN